MKKQAGMTLIELVIVIIVLGIIAAVAAPRFADIQGNAATAAQSGLQGNFNSAYVIALGAAQGVPDWVEFSAQVGSDFDCTTTAGTCTSADLDGDGNADVEYDTYQAGTCLAGEVADAATELVINYTVDINGAGPGACTAF